MAETYYIKVINETRGKVTQVSMLGNPSSPNNRISNDVQKDIDSLGSLNKSVGMATKASALGVGIAIDYFDTSGEQAKANRVKVGAQFAGAFVAGFKYGGPGGAVTAVAVLAGKQQLDYKRERINDNAMTEYLREQTKTRNNNSKGDYYRWKI